METTPVQTELGRAAFITQATAASIACRIPKQSFMELSGELYRRPIYIFSRVERLRLLAIQYFFQDSETFIDLHYQKAERDRQDPNLVFPSSAPAYHLSIECKFLHADYRNIVIPPQIEVRGESVKKEFRIWFRQNEGLYDNNRELFMVKLSTRFNIRLQELQIIERLNSGTTEVLNENLDAIDAQINRVLREAGQFYYASERNNGILKQYQRYTELGYKEEALHSNRTGYPEDEVKTFLRGYNEQFKKPLKKLLTSYFRVKYNPELRFNGFLMGQLGIKPCKHCAQKWGRKEIFSDRKRTH